MAVTVIPDIAHPAAKVTKTRDPDSLYTKYEVVRVFLVEGLDDGSSNQSATALARALAASGIPVQGSPAPGQPGQGGAVALDYATIVIPGSDNSVYLLVIYRNAAPGSPVAFLVSDDTELTVESTQLHPRDKSPMIYSYQPPMVAQKNAPANPNAPANNPTFGKAVYFVVTPTDTQAKAEPKQANFRYSRPIRKVVLQGYVIEKDLNASRSAIGSVNLRTWLNYPPGYWRLDEFRTESVLFGQIIKVTVGLTSRVNENWMVWEPFYSGTLGRTVTVKAEDKNKILKRGYFYGWQAENGIIAAGLYPFADFKSILGIG